MDEHSDVFEQSDDLLAKEGKFWLVAISVLFAVLIFAAYYRFGGLGRPTPISHSDESAPSLALLDDLEHDPQSSSQHVASDGSISGDSISGDSSPKEEVIVPVTPPSINLENKRQLQVESAAKPALPEPTKSLTPANSTFQPRIDKHQKNLAESTSSRPSERLAHEHRASQFVVPQKNELPQSTNRELPIERISEENSNPKIEKFINIGSPYPGNSKSIRAEMPGNQTTQKINDDREPKIASRIPDLPGDPIQDQVELVQVELKERLENDSSIRNREEQEKDQTHYSTTAKENDSYWAISQRVYGTGQFFRALHQLNQPFLGDSAELEPGAMVRTPPAQQLIKRYPEFIPDDVQSLFDDEE